MQPITFWWGGIIIDLFLSVCPLFSFQSMDQTVLCMTQKYLHELYNFYLKLSAPIIIEFISDVEVAYDHAAIFEASISYRQLNTCIVEFISVLFVMIFRLSVSIIVEIKLLLLIHVLLIWFLIG